MSRSQQGPSGLWSSVNVVRTAPRCPSNSISNSKLVVIIVVVEFVHPLKSSLKYTLLFEVLGTKPDIEDNAFPYYQYESTLNLVTDLVVFVLPLSVIIRLYIAIRNKVALCILFSIVILFVYLLALDKPISAKCN